MLFVRQTIGQEINHNDSGLPEYYSISTVK